MRKLILVAATLAAAALATMAPAMADVGPAPGFPCKAGIKLNAFSPYYGQNRSGLVRKEIKRLKACGVRPPTREEYRQAVYLIRKKCGISCGFSSTLVSWAKDGGGSYVAPAPKPKPLAVAPKPRKPKLRYAAVAEAPRKRLAPQSWDGGRKAGCPGVQKYAGQPGVMVIVCR